MANSIEGFQVKVCLNSECTSWRVRNFKDLLSAQEFQLAQQANGSFCSILEVDLQKCPSCFRLITLSETRCLCCEDIAGDVEND